MKSSFVNPQVLAVKSMVGLCAVVGLVMLSACGQKPSGGATDSNAKEEAKAFSGTFTVGGKSFTGKISTQKFPATGEFSVLCEDEKAGLIQLTFHDEATARTQQNLTSGIRSMTPPVNPKLVSVSYLPLGAGTNLDSKSETADAIKIIKATAGNEVTFDQLPMAANDGTKDSISGKLAY